MMDKGLAGMVKLTAYGDTSGWIASHPTIIPSRVTCGIFRRKSRFEARIHDQRLRFEAVLPQHVAKSHKLLKNSILS
ncbi:hypothetical protein B30_16373 [Celeribacter baekdonensis B30]|uniref:Uncharacterized protein n=1 Tax=Celeribacter baekdonensis B30 TaxID=1208323 RepID=K2JFE9_9RHOB|nr:hypothetical protein B30_16373 [Celeribacter baekdonensis B30]